MTPALRPEPADANGSPRSIENALGILACASSQLERPGIWLVGSRGEPSAQAVPRLQNAMQVTSSLDVESYPTWSPDGPRLAYQASEAATTTWQPRHLGGSARKRRAGEPDNCSQANDRRPSWSPDGREIAFFSDRDGGWGVYTRGGDWREPAQDPRIAWH